MTKENNREFPTVLELSQGFSEFRLPQSEDFIGKRLELNYEKGYKVIYDFIDFETLKCSYIQGDTEEMVASMYTLVSPRDNIYILDFIWSYGETKSITTVIDLNKNIATTLVGVLPNKEEVSVSQFERGDKGLPFTSVRAEFNHASINSKFTKDTLKHEFTDELVGERIEFKYSQNDTYEHIYLNEKYYTWHCKSGVEKGLCDTDRCYYLKLDEKLYWFTWLERIVPTVGTVVEDLKVDKMRSYGKLYGYESYDMGRVTNFPVGSYAKII